MNANASVDTTSLRRDYAASINEAKKLLAAYTGKENEMPAEVGDQIQSWLGKSDEIKSKLETINRVNEGVDLMNQPADRPAVSWRTAGPDEGNHPVDEKAWRSVKMATASGDRELRYHIPMAVDKKGYDKAFEAYLRYGVAAVKERFPKDWKTLSEGVDTAGGFLVPEDFHAELIKKTATYGAVRANARVVQTSRDVATWPRVNYTTDNKYTSGVRMSWTGETPASATTARVTDPVFGQINIPVHVATASMPLTNSLVEDSAMDVMGYSAELLGEAFALGENDTFLNGTGIAQPLGMLTQVDVANVGITSVVSGTSALIYTAADAHNGKRVIDLYYNLPAQYRRNGAIFMMNSLTLAAVDNLVDAQKRPLIGPMTMIGLQSGEPGSIKSRPVLVDEFVPDIGASTYPIIFGQFTGYTIVDRVGFSIQRLTELYAETDITLLLARKRVGGFLSEPYRFRVMKCST